MGFVIRQIQKEDYPIIFNSWLKSYSKDFVKHKNVPSHIYYQGQHILIEKLLENSEVLVAADEEDQSIVLGYCVGNIVNDVFVVHYLYVKKDFRGMKIATKMLEFAGVKQDSSIVYTHYTPSGAKFGSKFNAIYHPYILLGGV